ncbi:MAG: hypothetical protein F4103_17135 [Boseongicola sp. SB0673_bin_14]|nr:hypothetical protein [Boseongicola sp. SB0673_bin_14]
MSQQAPVAHERGQGPNKTPPGCVIGIKRGIVNGISGTGSSRFLAAASMARSNGKDWRSMPIWSARTMAYLHVVPVLENQPLLGRESIAVGQ